MCMQSLNYHQAQTQSTSAPLFPYTSFHLSYTHTHTIKEDKRAFASSEFYKSEFQCRFHPQRTFVKQDNRLGPCDRGWQIYEADLCHGCHVRVQCVSEVAQETSNWIIAIWQGWTDDTTVLDPHSKDVFSITIDPTHTLWCTHVCVCFYLRLNVCTVC